MSDDLNDEFAKRKVFFLKLRGDVPDRAYIPLLLGMSVGVAVKLDDEAALGLTGLREVLTELPCAAEFTVSAIGIKDAPADVERLLIFAFSEKACSVVVLHPKANPIDFKVTAFALGDI